MKVNNLLFKTGSKQSYYSYQKAPVYYSGDMKNDTVSFGMRINYGIPAELDKALQSQIAFMKMLILFRTFLNNILKNNISLQKSETGILI